MITVGIKELKNRLSHYLREIKKGGKIVITEREKVIAAIVSVERADEDSRLLSLVKEGFAIWKGGKPVGSRLKYTPLSRQLFNKNKIEF